MDERKRERGSDFMRRREKGRKSIDMTCVVIKTKMKIKLKSRNLEKQMIRKKSKKNLVKLLLDKNVRY